MSSRSELKKFKINPIIKPNSTLTSTPVISKIPTIKKTLNPIHNGQQNNVGYSERSTQ